MRLGHGLVEAVKAIHSAGVVHRDIKPGNVLMVDGDPVLIDFGIAHVADDSRLTMTGLVMGTPGYLSPEIVEGAEVSDATDWLGRDAGVRGVRPRAFRPRSDVRCPRPGHTRAGRPDGCR